MISILLILLLMASSAMALRPVMNKTIPAGMRVIPARQISPAMKSGVPAWDAWKMGIVMTEYSATALKHAQMASARREHIPVLKG